MQQSARRPAGSKRWRRRLLAFGLAAVAGGLALELGVRHLALGAGGADARWAPFFRQPWRYASPDTDAFWILRERMAAPDERSALHSADALLGWTGSDVEPGTRHHVREAALDARRLILLYGDSFADCTVPAEDCFEGLLEESPAGARLQLLNFGVGGYGLDQICLLLGETVGRFAARDPIVVVGILVDDDLDRLLLTRRPWPKPRYRLAGGALRLEPPAPERLAQPPAEAPTGIVSYAWRRLVYGARLFPAGLRERLEGRARREREKRALARTLLRDTRDLLDGLGLRHFVLLFHTRESVGSGASGWQEPFLRETLTELGVPFVSARPFLAADAAATGRSLDAYYDPARQNHHGRLGNEVVLRALLAGVEED